MRAFLFAALLIGLLAACSSNKEIPYEERAVEDIYNEAMREFSQGNYRTAATLFDEVERQHPYSAWARQAQIMAAFSYYQRQRYAEAISTLDRFIRLHPGHENIAYAYYLRAISYYEQISDVRRDQSMTRQAQAALNEVIARFPGTPYARDARLKYDLTQNHLAGKEMSVGRYYQRVDNHLAAINRFQRVVDKFQTTTHVEEALHRLTESYLRLGLIQQARKSAAVLGHNYPGSVWYERSYALLVNEQGEFDPTPAPERGFFGQSLDYLLN